MLSILLVERRFGAPVTLKATLVGANNPGRAIQFGIKGYEPEEMYSLDYRIDG
jgi:hypothetical protein